MMVNGPFTTGFLAPGLTFESTCKEQAVVIPNQFDGFVEEMYKKTEKRVLQLHANGIG